MQIGLLGPLEVRVDGHPLEVPGRLLRVLLGRLAAAVPRPVGADVLIEALWPGTAPADPANSLQSLVSRLRRVIGDPALILQTSGGYRLDVPTEDVDVVRFGRLVDRGHAELTAGSFPAAVDTLRAASACWRGDPLPDDDGADVLSWRRRLVEQHARASLDRLTAELELGPTAAAGVVGEVEGLLAHEPLREDLVAVRLRALVAAGRPAEALAAFEETRRRLAEELGTDPSPRLRALHADLLAGPPEETDHRTNLRATVTSFVGREADVSRLDDLLGQGRLVTVVGPGGAGKTRVATEVAAARVTRAPDGVWFVELAPVGADGIALAVLDALGVRDVALVDKLGDGPRQDPTARVLGRLGPARCLLVLDNCEHVVDAAAAFVAELLGRCAGVRVLVTSREPLGVDGEILHPLPPLVVPSAADRSAADVAASPAVRLLLDRARAVGADLVLDDRTSGAVVEIVRRLDGLPLAIELAAARLRVLSVTEVADRLSDRFRLLTGGRRTAVARHRTLRAVVEWSWDLLTPAERDVAERFCVFAAGATTDAVAAVCGRPTDEAEDLLAALVDKSLLVAEQDAPGGGPTRYRMLETLREYGSERLGEAGTRAAVDRAHAVHYAGLARLDDARLRSGEQVSALRRFDAERENHLAAVAHLCDQADAGGALDLVARLCWAWMLRGNGQDAHRWLHAALAVPGAAQQPMHPLVSALALVSELITTGEDLTSSPRLLEAAARVAVTEPPAGDPVRALQVILPALLLSLGGDREGSDARLDALRLDHDPWVRAAARSVTMVVAENDGDVDVVRREVDAAVTEWTGLGDPWWLSGTLSARAELRTLDGDLTGAAADLEGALEQLRTLGGDSEDAVSLLRLSDLALRRGDLVRARAYATRLWADRRYQTSGSGVDLLGDALAVALGLQEDDGPAVAAAAGRIEVGLASSSVLHGFRGHAAVAAWVCLAGLAIRAGDLDLARTRIATAHGLGQGTHDAPLQAAVGVTLAELALALGLERTAARTLAAGARLRGSPDATDLRIARLTAALRERLGPELDVLVAEATALDREAALRAVDPDVVLPLDGPAQARRR